ncbi:uncharacterized protein BX663DRAFT_548291 [Cokeromyces recurvatus]|uniref:uncharacterized protein n=1 Tax=Cokeromyces recurvatus TaxID=90255 RepID=UPI002220655E|nr:uncharacterized protein BX663DRAFT_548291 [Cokeromyces recurvatus]KAI7907224.1 hypothetical protein BX663DRAFT_548291 [Cokeromyces recurvatus]
MLSTVQHTLQGNEVAEEQYHFLSQYQSHTSSNSRSFIHSYHYDSNFEVANRAFYATIKKFTRQNCSNGSQRRSSPYSFLENWHLHSMYSKSQQTLLGITPVRPSVILSGDDFMFTLPFIEQEIEEQEEEEEEEEEEDDDEEEYNYDEDWEDSYYSLSPCPNSINRSEFFFYDNNDDEVIQHISDNDEEDKERFENINRLLASTYSPTLLKDMNEEEDYNFNSVICNQNYYSDSLQMNNNHERRPKILKEYEPITLTNDHCPLIIDTFLQQHDDAVVLDMDPHVPSLHDVPELSPTSISSNEYDTIVTDVGSNDSTTSLMNLTRLSTDHIIQCQDVTPFDPMTCSSQKSTKKDSSYQSLADLIPSNATTSSITSDNTTTSSIESDNTTSVIAPMPMPMPIPIPMPTTTPMTTTTTTTTTTNPTFYGSIDNTTQTRNPMTFFDSIIQQGISIEILFICIMYVWQFLVQVKNMLFNNSITTTRSEEETDYLL